MGLKSSRHGECREESSSAGSIWVCLEYAEMDSSIRLDEPQNVERCPISRAKTEPNWEWTATVQSTAPNQLATDVARFTMARIDPLGALGFVYVLGLTWPCEHGEASPVANSCGHRIGPRPAAFNTEDDQISDLAARVSADRATTQCCSTSPTLQCQTPRRCQTRRTWSRSPR